MWFKIQIVKLCLWTLDKMGWEWPVMVVPVQTLLPSSDLLRDSSTFVKTVQ